MLAAYVAGEAVGGSGFLAVFFAGAVIVKTDYDCAIASSSMARSPPRWRCCWHSFSSGRCSRRLPVPSRSCRRCCSRWWCCSWPVRWPLVWFCADRRQQTRPHVHRLVRSTGSLLAPVRVAGGIAGRAGIGAAAGDHRGRGHHLGHSPWRVRDTADRRIWAGDDQERPFPRNGRRRRPGCSVATMSMCRGSRRRNWPWRSPVPTRRSCSMCELSRRPGEAMPESPAACVCLPEKSASGRPASRRAANRCLLHLTRRSDERPCGGSSPLGRFRGSALTGGLNAWRERYPVAPVSRRLAPVRPMCRSEPPQEISYSVRTKGARTTRSSSTRDDIQEPPR